jgi:hypothetical protein
MTGVELRHLLGAYARTQASLARDLGVAPRTVSRYVGTRARVPRMMELAVYELQRRWPVPVRVKYDEAGRFGLAHVKGPA